MSYQDRCPISRRLVVTAIASALLGIGAVTPGVMAAPGTTQSGTEAPLMLAETKGMERRQDRRDSRQDCRQEEGLVGGDKRECKQDRREERGSDEDDKGSDEDDESSEGEDKS